MEKIGIFVFGVVVGIGLKELSTLIWNKRWYDAMGDVASMSRRRVERICLMSCTADGIFEIVTLIPINDPYSCYVEVRKISGTALVPEELSRMVLISGYPPSRCLVEEMANSVINYLSNRLKMQITKHDNIKEDVAAVRVRGDKFPSLTEFSRRYIVHETIAFSDFFSLSCSIRGESQLKFSIIASVKTNKSASDYIESELKGLIGQIIPNGGYYVFGSLSAPEAYKKLVELSKTTKLDMSFRSVLPQ